MQVISQGSVRVDLLGGTLDLEPINLILPNVVTLNVATSLLAQVEIQKIDEPKLVIESKDYRKEYSYEQSELTDEKILYSDYFKEMTFLMQIIWKFKMKVGYKIILSSKAPAGSGLGGSSAMGITLFKSLLKLNNQIEKNPHHIVRVVRSIESRILNQGIAGYQDYYPALYGGVLALRADEEGIQVEQLYSEDLVEFLQDHLTLVYSGDTRASGINNWEVYKGFFDKKNEIRTGLTRIAQLSFKAYEAIKNKKFEVLLNLIGQEGQEREKLFPTIMPPRIKNLLTVLESEKVIYGSKMCGAGGGGCFILTHPKDQKDQILHKVKKASMEVLEFQILPPLSSH